MKTKTTIIVALLATLIISAANLLAQVTPPTSLPFLASRAALGVYATKASRQVELQFQSAGAVNPWPWGTGSMWQEEATSVQILERFDALTMNLPVVNTADAVEAKATITDGMGNPLRVAKSSAMPQVGAGGNYTLPPLWFWFELAEEIRVKLFRGITAAQLYYVDERSNTLAHVNLAVDDAGGIFFKTDFAGKCFLVLRDADGNYYAYDLRQEDGVRIPIENVQSVPSQSFFEGQYHFDDPPSIDWQVWSWRGVGRNPSFEIAMSRKAIVNVSVHSNEGALPIGYMVQPPGSTNWVPYSVTSPPANYLPITMSPGTSYIVPVWNEDEFKEPEPYIPDDGKGTIVIPGKG